MSTVAAGEIVFVNTINEKEYTELANLITNVAILSEIGVNLQHNISMRINKRFNKNNPAKSQYSRMAYELTENQWSSQSDALFDRAIYNDDFTCAGIDKNHSKVIGIQNFFESIFKLDLVKEITFELWEELPPKECGEMMTINYKCFLDVLDKAYQGIRATDSSLTPTLLIKMTK